jgi:hypothetical protein
VSSPLCADCSKACAGQTGRNSLKRYKEHHLSFRNNNTLSEFAQYLLEDVHTFGRTESIMEILSFNKKGMQFDTIKGFYIYNEGTFNNELNVNILSVLKRYSRLLSIREDADTSPPYPYTFSHFLIPHPYHSTSLVPPHTSLPVTTFDDLADDYIRPQRLQDNGCTFWIPDTVLL